MGTLVSERKLLTTKLYALKFRIVDSALIREKQVRENPRSRLFYAVVFLDFFQSFYLEVKQFLSFNDSYTLHSKLSCTCLGFVK